MKNKPIFFILIFLIFLLAFIIRVYFPYDRVFSFPMKYASDDGVYHMRLIENELLGGNFPNRIDFDPFTYFPHGTYIHFTPFFDQLLAGIIWLAGLGNPTQELIDKIAPYYPVVLGSLVVFVIYFLAKSLWGKKTALLASLFVAVSPSLVHRSFLGVTDHHVAEVLFSSLSMMFLIFALQKRPSISSVLTNREFFSLAKDVQKNKKFWWLIFLAGFSLGLYFLSWSGAILFLGIILFFIVIYYLLGYLLSDPPTWILPAGIFIFSISLAMIVPFFGKPDLYHSPMYNIKHLIFLIGGIFGLCFLWILGNFFTAKKVKPKHFFVFLVIFLLTGFAFLKIGLPLVFQEIIRSFRMINTGMSPNQLARELTGEMSPMSFQGAINTFGPLFFFALAALAIILYRFVKKRNAEYLLIVIWTVAIMLMTGVISVIGQNRISCYLSFNISLFSGFLIVKGLEFGWKGLKIAEQTHLDSKIQPYFLIGSLFTIFSIIFYLLFPFPFNIGQPFSANLPSIFRGPLEAAKSSRSGQSDDWYEALLWMRNSTPDPGIDYYGVYEEPKFDEESGKVAPYDYPPQAYGILARWDIGHMITYYAHRIPNANPFHQGVGESKGAENEEVGQTTFFLETDENKAAGYLDLLRTRYIVTDYPDPEGLFRNMVKWLQGNTDGYDENSAPTIGPSKYDSSMIVRLHIFDGGEEIISQTINDQKKDFFVTPLDHFRLVYESGETISLYKGNPEKEIKTVKIFEYVKGAKISGKAAPGTKIKISTEIATNQKRRITFKREFDSPNPNFEIIVPYSTGSSQGSLNQTKTEVVANPYRLQIGDKEITVNVSEEDILGGKVIKVN